MEIRLLGIDEIELWKSSIEGALEDSEDIWKDFTSLDDIIYQLEEGHSQYWMIMNGNQPCLAFMTQICDDAVIVFWGYGETSDEILHLCNEATQNLGLMYGATRVEVHGRSGFLRKFRKWGFTLQKLVISKSIERRMN